SRRRHTRSYGDWSSDVCSSDLSINDAGQITGTTTAGNGIVQAFLWQNGVLQALGSPHGASSSAVRITASGLIAGNSHNPWIWKRSEERRVGEGCRLKAGWERCR